MIGTITLDTHLFLLSRPYLVVFTLQIPIVSSSLCNTCNVKISHKFPFYNLAITSFPLLEILYSDGWTSLSLSYDEERYYIIFVDHYTIYLYMVFIHQTVTSKHLMSLLAFELQSKNSLKRLILQIYYDNGLEFLKLTPRISTNKSLTTLLLPILHNTMVMNDDIVIQLKIALRFYHTLFANMPPT